MMGEKLAELQGKRPISDKDNTRKLRRQSRGLRRPSEPLKAVFWRQRPLFTPRLLQSLR